MVRELAGLALLFWAAFLFVSLVTYSPTDPSINLVVAAGHPVHNAAGIVGAYASGLLVDLFGVASYFWPILCLYLGLYCFLPRLGLSGGRWLGFLLLYLSVMAFAAEPFLRDGLSLGAVHGGGLAGSELHRWSRFLFRSVGSALVWTFVFLSAIQLTLGVTLTNLFGGLGGFLRRTRDRVDAIREAQAERAARKRELAEQRAAQRAAEAELALPGQNAAAEAGEPAVAGTTAGLLETLNADEDEEDGEDTPEAEEKGGFFGLFRRFRREPAPEVDEEEPLDQALLDSLTSGRKSADPAPASAAALVAVSAAPAPAPATMETPAAPPATPPIVWPEPVTEPAVTDVQAGPEPAYPVSQEDQSDRPGRIDFDDFGFPEEDQEEAAAHTPGDVHIPPDGLQDWTKIAEQERRVVTPSASRMVSPLAPPSGGDSITSMAGTRPIAVKTAPAPQAAELPAWAATELPPLEFLAAGSGGKPTVDMEKLKFQAERLVSSLNDFGVNGEVQAIVPGPVVTMFEYKPAPGVKIARIANLTDDLAMALKALSMRIEAIPGKDTVGIEIPNERRETVFLRDIIAAPAFTDSSSKLSLALGKDIQGVPVAAPLDKMPHLLVAGATGAGKSVCLNAILLSLLYKASPDEVKLLLVDPKRIELSAYADLPHLVHPVVTEMPMAKSALDWAVWEMNRRYQAMARLGVRNIDGFNEKLPTVDPERFKDLGDLRPLPYLVLVIDELADLMMTAGKEAEMAIVRLAQLARAAGIHLILATQRPSVDVVTGLIKANFPSRISFQVTSKHDSRTILDTGGAEKLLGRGDMLFKPGGGKIRRLHGAYVSEEEIADVVGFWRERHPQAFELDFTAWGQEGSGEGGENGGEGVEGDPIYNEAVDFVVAQGKASISLIQRRFRIGFNRAARFIEQMEKDGLLGPQEGSRPRAVIRKD